MNPPKVSPDLGNGDLSSRLMKTNSVTNWCFCWKNQNHNVLLPCSCWVLLCGKDSNLKRQPFARFGTLAKSSDRPPDTESFFLEMKKKRVFLYFGSQIVLWWPLRLSFNGGIFNTFVAKFFKFPFPPSCAAALEINHFDLNRLLKRDLPKGRRFWKRWKMEGVERWKVEDSNLKHRPVLCGPRWTFWSWVPNSNH